MPAVLAPEETVEYLSSMAWLFLPYTGPLVIAACASPLVQPRDGGDQRAGLGDFDPTLDVV